MPCTPFVVAPGFFNPNTWSTAPTLTVGGTTVTYAAGGPNPGISVTRGGVTSPYIQQLANQLLSYILWGNGYVLVLVLDTLSANRSVIAVDISSSTLTQTLLFSYATSEALGVKPIVHLSAGTGATAGTAFMIYGSTGTDLVSLSIRRSDNGTVLLAGPGFFVPAGTPSAEADASSVKLHYNPGGGTTTLTQPLPSGSSKITPALPGGQTFPDAVIGGPSSLATTTDQFIILNDGNDCLDITAIGNSGPFSVASTSKPLPATLQKNESMTVTIAFTPTAVGPTGNVDLPVTRSPSKGDSVLRCKGTGVAATAAISALPLSLSFGKRPVGGPYTLNGAIKNNGTLPLTVSWPASPGGSPFQWTAFNGPLPYNGSVPIAVTFSPGFAGFFSETVNISGIPASSFALAITGRGCLAVPQIQPPPTAPLDFGQVQQGFRTVRTFVVKNPGEGTLTFRGRISGADAALFGLQPETGSVIDVLSQRDYQLEPVSPCGPGTAGSGEVIVAVAFFAGQLPGPISAQLIIENHNVPTGPASWTYPLTATIIAGVTVDVALILDRSGSMDESSGDRVKIDGAISAARLFTQLMRPDVDDRLAIVRFNSDPEVLDPITAVTSGNQVSLMTKLNTTDLAPTGGTCIAGGLAFGFQQLALARPSPPAALVQSVLVLTDGKSNVPWLNPADGKYYGLTGGPEGFLIPIPTQPLPIPVGVRMYAIGIGDSIDVARLNYLAQTSGGYFGVVGALSGQTYFDLEKFFVQILMDTAGTAVVKDPVFTIQSGETQRIEFTVLDGDVTAMVVLLDKEGFRLPFWLETPSGEKIDVSVIPVGFQLRSGFTETARYLEVRMPHGEPDRYGGTWTVVIAHDGEVCVGRPVAPGQGGRWGFLPSKCRKYDQPLDYGISIGVGSNLQLQAYVTAQVVRVGESILLTGVLTEMGLPVIDAVITVKATSPSGATSVLTLMDNAASGGGSSNDGEYAASFTQTAESGGYQFLFHASGVDRQGRPMEREAIRGKYVEGREPILPPGRGEVPPKDCCSWLSRLLIGIIALLILITLLLLWRWVF